MNVAELFIKVVLDSKTFESNMDRATDKTEELKKGQEELGKEVDKTAKKAEDGAKKTGNAWDSLKGKLMGLLSVTAVISTATAFAEQTKQVEQYSNRVGMSVADWQGWSNAVEAAGGNAEAFGDRVGDIAERLYEFGKEGTGAIAEFAERTGAKFTDAQGNLLSVNDSLLTIAETVEGMSKEQATGVLKGLGLDNESIDLFLKGRKAVEAYVKAGKEKAVYDKRDIENGAKIRNAYNQLGKTYQLLGARMVGALMPVFEKVGEYAGKAFDFIKEHSESVERVFKMLGVAISVALIPKLKQMAVAAWASLGPWAVLIGAFTAIGLAIDDLIVWLDGGNSALGEFWSMFGTADEVREKLAGIKDTFFGILEAVKPLAPTVLKFVGALAGLVALKRTFTAVVSGISAASTAMKALFVLMRANPIGLIITAIALVISNFDKLWAVGSALLDSLGSAASAMGEAFSAVFGGIRDSVVQTFKTLIGWVKSFCEAIAGAAFGAVGAIKATFLGAWDAIGGAASGALDAIKGAFAGAANFVREVWEALFGWLIGKFEAIAGKAREVINFGKGVVSKVTGTVKGWFGGGDKNTDAGAGAGAGAPTLASAHAGTGAYVPAYAGAHAGAYAGTGSVHEAVAGGGYGAPANARPGNVSNDNRKTVNIDQTNNITVQTQATSADGIGSAVGEAMNRNTAAQADVAFGA